MFKWVLTTNDTVWDKTIQWLANKRRVSLLPSFVRFAIVPFIISVSFFIFTLAASMHSFYLSSVKDNLMIGEYNPAVTLLVLSIFLTIVGVLAFAVAVSLVVYYVRHQNTEDPIISVLRSIQEENISKLSEIMTGISDTKAELKGIKEGLELITALQNRGNANGETKPNKPKQ